MDLSFWKGKKVFLTGHTGFKGTWMSKILAMFGARVVGYSLPPNPSPSLFEISGVNSDIESIYGDVRDLEKLVKVFKQFKPDIAIHMAAQPLVRDSYNEPVYTYAVNVMGTVHFLEAVRPVNIRGLIKRLIYTGNRGEVDNRPPAGGLPHIGQYQQPAKCLAVV